MNRSVQMVATPLLLAATAAAVGDAVITDPLSLSAVMQAARADLDQISLSYTVQRADADVPVQFPTQHYRVDWDLNGYRIEVVTYGSDSGKPFDDDVVRQFDAAASKATLFDGVENAYVSTSPQALSLDQIIPEMMGAVGVFPMRTLTGAADFTSNPLVALATGRAVIGPELEVVNGVSCVRIDLLHTDGPSPYAISRGYYAPSLGYAQIRMEMRSPEGQPLGRWDTLEWIDRGPDAVALPLTTRHTRWSGADVVGITDMVIESLDDVPQIFAGLPVDLSIEFPDGTSIHDLDTGAITVVRADLPEVESPSALARAVSFGLPALAGLGLVAASTRRRR